MERIKDYKDLDIWKLAIQLIAKVYRLLATFPKEERFGLIAQAKDSVVSIASNIAEAWGRFHFKDRKNFIFHARGSLLETESHLFVGQALGYINKDNEELFEEILKDIKNLSVKINNFITSISKNIP